jgi:hypothetical protein
MEMIWIMMLCLQDEPVRMPLQVSTPAKSIQGVVELSDESSIAHLVTGFNKDDISLEVKQNRIFIKLLSEVEGSIDCVGASGRLYRIYVVPSARSVTNLALRGKPARAREKPEVPLPLQLMRAMRLGETFEGAMISRASAVVVDDPSFVVQLQWVYKLDEFTGFVCTLRNRTQAPLRIDPSRFRGENVLVIGVRDMKLGPGEVTRVYFVVDEHE